MPIEIQVHYDTRDIAVWLTRANMPQLKRAVASALNRTITQVKTQATRSVRSEVKLKAKDIHDRLVLIRAHSSKSASLQMQAIMKISGKPVPLISYGARQTKKGLAVHVKKSRVILKHAFMARMRSGHGGIFVRKTKKRLPIQELYSTRVSDVFKNTGFIPKLTHFAQGKFSHNFAHNMTYFLQHNPN